MAVLTRSLWWLLAASSLLMALLLITQPAAAAEPVQVRVLTYNIHIGIGMDKKLDIARTAAVIKRLKPDLAAFQEVDRFSKRVGGVDQPAELARLTGMHAAFAKALAVPGGEYGELLLSRYPLQEVRRQGFPSEEKCESRAAVTAKVKLGDRGPEIWFIGTHLEHANAAVRLHQAEALLRATANLTPAAAILAGDFNATPESPVLKMVAQQWQDATISAPGPTWPANKPARKIDYVFYRPAGAWRVVSSEVIHEPLASDHSPVLVVLEWTGP